MNNKNIEIIVFDKLFVVCMDFVKMTKLRDIVKQNGDVGEEIKNELISSLQITHNKFPKNYTLNILITEFLTLINHYFLDNNNDNNNKYHCYHVRKISFENNLFKLSSEHHYLVMVF